jgi:hypothetical protein
MPRLISPVAALLLIAGCAAAAGPPALRPAAAARGSATSADVEIVGLAGAWRGWPSALGRFVTPIHVTMVNRGAVSVRVSFDDFALTPTGGRRLAAVLPTEVRGIVHEPPPPPRSSTGLALGADGYERDWVLPGSALSARADPAARVGDPFALPSPDVLDRALPEGVLAPGETASGFVYFEPGPGPGPVELTARLMDAGSGELLGRAAVSLTLP